MGKVWHYPEFVRLFHTSTPLRSVELRMKKESRDLVASTGHLCRDRRRAFLFGLIHHLSSLRHRSHCLSFFFFHFQVTYVALGLLNHNRDLVGNSVLDCLRGKASLFFLTQFKLNIVYHLVIPS